MQRHKEHNIKTLYFAETAINIGYSCRLLTDEMEDLFVVDGETYDEVESQLQEALDSIKKTINGENRCQSLKSVFKTVKRK